MSLLKDSYNLEPQDLLNKVLLALGEEDPIFFAEYFLGLHLNPFQKRFLLTLVKYNQILSVTANQVGKTVAIAIAHIWWNFYKKGFSGNPELIEKAHFETLNISPISRQSKEAFRDIEEILNSNFSWEEGGERYINDCKIKWFWEAKNENLGRIDFSNNSSCYCLSTSEDKGAGFAGKQFALISYDECVQSLHLREELPARIFSRTAKYSGTIILNATPDELAKSQQFWYHLYTDAKRGEGEWNLVEGLYDENIFIPEKKREEYKERLRKLDPIKYKQVVLGEFIASAERMFTSEMVEGLWNGKDKPTSVILDRDYVIIIDWGIAESGDETVILVADVTEFENQAEIVYAYSKQGGDPVELMAMASYLNLEFNSAPIVMDTTEMGGIIFKKMLERCKPISFGQGNKPDALFYLQVRLRNNIRKDLTNSEKSAMGKLRSYYLPKLEEQLSSYKLDDKKIKQDWVMVLAMLCWYVDKYKTITQVKVYPLTKFYKSP